jgi:hypothetical protein
MSAPAWEDLDEFLDEDEFAIPAYFTPLAENSEPFRVVGIFDDAYTKPRIGEYEMDTQKPRFICKETDAVNIHRSMQCVIAGENYLVSTVQQEGAGLAHVMLEFE